MKIEEAASEVARAVLTERGGYEQFPDLYERDLILAHDAAIRMSQKLGHSVDANEFLAKTIEFQGRSAEIAQSHTQVFIVAGYAAFFALWSTMATAVSEEAMLLSGAAMVVSLVVFVGWTICGMIISKLCVDRTLRLYLDGPVDFWPRLVQVEQDNLASRGKLMRWWPAIVAVAGGTALLATVTLGWASASSFIDKVQRDHRAGHQLRPSGSALPEPSPPSVRQLERAHSR